MKFNVDNIALDNNQTWEKTINLKPDRIGTNMTMEFLLYAYGSEENISHSRQWAAA